jgi:hypothetical protein
VARATVPDSRHTWPPVNSVGSSAIAAGVIGTRPPAAPFVEQVASNDQQGEADEDQR